MALVLIPGNTDIGRSKMDSSAETFLTFLYLKLGEYSAYCYLGLLLLLLQKRKEKKPPPELFFSFFFDFFLVIAEEMDWAKVVDGAYGSAKL